MSMRPVPASWEEFQVYWDHMCRNVLEDNFAARAVLDLTELPKPRSRNGFRIGYGPSSAKSSPRSSYG